MNTAPGTNFSISSGFIAPNGALLYQGAATSGNRRYAKAYYKSQKRIFTSNFSYWDMAGNVSKCTTGDVNGTYVAHNIFETFQAIDALGGTDGIYFQTAASCVSFAVQWAVDAEL